MEKLNIIFGVATVALFFYATAWLLIDLFKNKKKKQESWIDPVRLEPKVEEKGLYKAMTTLNQQKALTDALIEEKRLANQKKKIELAESVVLATANIIAVFKNIGETKHEPSLLPWKVKRVDTCRGNYQEVCLHAEYKDVGIFTFASVKSEPEDAVNFYKKFESPRGVHKFEVTRHDRDENGVTVVVRMSKIQPGSMEERYKYLECEMAKNILMAHGLSPDLFEDGGKPKKPETTNLTYHL